MVLGETFIFRFYRKVLRIQKIMRVVKKSILHRFPLYRNG
ncbi:hypothetical protein LEP1GSC083_2712 [Leptospira interrogans serovar Pyrogenes str. L0374]|uniref:Uncharacterized protein n=6 Tax=Leptospira interrogans TaxID=173 RepID=A0A829DAE0_LEPIR|nr:hypothetical protein G436_3279 [Leptospira interrogans serovar Hardjo str. Norma]EKO04822.1 hypothetical protein LEP1GSC077_3719 [Leptospira interrogans str. C10069]EKQ38067.1 hypothetical protein LEP1GSC025_0631 [Leptospira interrogans str. 2002000621]EKQ46264.1 hypothetical protein LEP1GSC026_1640 [Leptospira interrogans str. 2002000623]EMF42548.1 hypothetical protein LEP1GSC067_4925 [Leptospira interrogans serovar Lora str. TE 1992]EMM96024.1 hypothetical protein LEP1GSC158_3269 [Leptosp